MTKEEFVALELQHQQSGKSLKKFLQGLSRNNIGKVFK